MKTRTNVPYYYDFQKYQTFTSVENMVETVTAFVKNHELSKGYKAVINTLKLHSKNYIGVCWMKREELAKKCGFSTDTVDRAIKEFKECGLLTVVPFMHTKNGGNTHNIYIINNLSSVTEANAEPNAEAYAEANAEASTPDGHDSNPCGTSVSEVQEIPYKNLEKNLNKNLDIKIKHKDLKFDNFDKSFSSSLTDLTELTQNPVSKEYPINPDPKHVSTSVVQAKCYFDDSTSTEDNAVSLSRVPVEFLDIMNPFYAEHPEIILSRWKTTCIAVKKTCLTMANTSWDTIKDVWKTAVNRYKRKLINNCNKAKTPEDAESALGGYYYKLLCDYLTHDFLTATCNNAIDAMDQDDLQGNNDLADSFFNAESIRLNPDGQPCLFKEVPLTMWG